MSCKQCGALKEELARKELLIKVSKSRFIDKCETVKEMQEHINLQEVKIKELSEEITKMEEGQIREEELNSQNTELMMECIDGLKDVVRMMIRLPDNYTATDMIGRTEPIINKIPN